MHIPHIAPADLWHRPGATDELPANAPLSPQRPQIPQAAQAAQTAQQRRREVRQLARRFDTTHERYELFTHAMLDTPTLVAFTRRFLQTKERLEALRDAAASDAAPASSVMRNWRCNALIGAAALTRAQAVVACGIGCAVESVARAGVASAKAALVTPFRGVESVVCGAIERDSLDSRLPVHGGSSMAAVGGAIVGGLCGTAGFLEPAANLPGEILTAPRHAVSRGALGRRLFRAADFLNVARRHAARESMRTSVIAAEVCARIDSAIENMEHQHRHPQAPVSSPYLLRLGPSLRSTGRH
jgi:hypothetical protein